MNIKEHIEAGHYPTDQKGRALVPHTEGGHVVVLATDGPGDRFPIVGWRIDKHGEFFNLARWEADAACLLPPPPRKVEVKRYLVVGLSYERGPYTERIDAERVARSSHPSGRVIELTGFDEQEW